MESLKLLFVFLTNRYRLCKLEKVSMGHGCPRLLFLFHLQLNIGYTISEQDTKFKLRKNYKNCEKIIKNESEDYMQM